MMEHKLGLAYYNKDDWSKFLKSIDDRRKVENTWDEWKKNFDEFVIMLISKNIDFEKININIDDMVEYFKKNKLKNISKNRSLYVSEVLRKKYE